MKNQKRGEKFQTVQVGSVVVKIYTRTRTTTTGETRTLWEVADYTSGVRRLRGFSDHGKAVQDAERIARAISAGNVAGANITANESAAFGRALELLRPTGMPLELAAAHYAQAFKILGGDRIIEAAKDFIRRNPVARPSRTVAEAAAELVALKTSRKAGPRYLDDLRTRLDTFAKVFVNVQVGNIGRDEIQAWLDGMKSAPRTVKNFRDTVNSLFKFCEARGYIARGDNPVALTEKITTRNSEKIEIYTAEELAKLLEAAPDSFRPVIAIQAFAGLRSAEVMRIDWQDVKLAKGFIEVAADKAKTASRRLAPITPNLAAWLAADAKRKGRIFEHSKAYFHEVQGKLAKRAGVPWKHNALRHSFVSYRLADISDVGKVALEAGNSPAMIFSNYRELVDASSAKAWFAVAPEAAANVVQLKGAA